MNSESTSKFDTDRSDLTKYNQNSKTQILKVTDIDAESSVRSSLDSTGKRKNKAKLGKPDHSEVLKNMHTLNPVKFNDSMSLKILIVLHR